MIYTNDPLRTKTEVNKNLYFISTNKNCIKQQRKECRHLTESYDFHLPRFDTKIEIIKYFKFNTKEKKLIFFSEFNYGGLCLPNAPSNLT